jgi:hypothetical protein
MGLSKLLKSEKKNKLATSKNLFFWDEGGNLDVDKCDGESDDSAAA